MVKRGGRLGRKVLGLPPKKRGRKASSPRKARSPRARNIRLVMGKRVACHVEKKGSPLQ
jgi:hypothetical protein